MFMNDKLKMLAYYAYCLRDDVLRMTTQAGSGHLTSCLSAADIVAALFFSAMKYNAQKFPDPLNDRFILSKGHAAPLLYAVWHELGMISEEELLTLRKLGSRLEGHPTHHFPYTEAATGSLGQGLSIALGYALHARQQHIRPYTYVLMGDSECAEGSVWEAAELGAFYQLDTVVAIIDMNRLGQSTQTMDDWNTKKMARKWESFGWKTFIVDGHDIAALLETFEAARATASAPCIIIAHTIKGRGLSICENKEGFHGKAFPPEQLNVLRQELAAHYPEGAHNHSPKTISRGVNLPIKMSAPHYPKVQVQSAAVPAHYAHGSRIATRRAYGDALCALGEDENVVVLDAEVKNSTFAELFEQKFPQRFVQCFIAEQNMIGMGVGFAARGAIPYISTFGAFMTRAHDQIRMAAIDHVPVRLAGSHAGLSIGEDGPSQMALEDIALMRTLPGSVVVQPCDAISAFQLVRCIGEYVEGVSYIRLMRSETPIIYTSQHEFFIGGGHVLVNPENPDVCIIGTGITVHEGLAAIQLLSQEQIAASLIDCYSIKPLPADVIREQVVRAQRRVIVVEDHYEAGGLGEAIADLLCNERCTLITLAVKKVPGSGTGEQLRAWAGIDAQSIYQHAREVCRNT
jgi:transketolase